MEIFDVSPPFSLSQLTLNFRIEFASNRYLTGGHQQAWQRTSQLRPNNPSVRPSIKQLCIAYADSSHPLTNRLDGHQWRLFWETYLTVLAKY